MLSRCFYRSVDISLIIKKDSAKSAWIFGNFGRFLSKGYFKTYFLGLKSKKVPLLNITISVRPNIHFFDNKSKVLEQ